MTKQELLTKKRNLLLSAIFFCIGSIGLLTFFSIAVINGNKDIFILLLDFLFAVGFAAFSYKSFKEYKILNNTL